MSESTASQQKYLQKTITNRLGLWLFLVSDAFVFGGLYIARFYLLGTSSRPEVNQFVGLIVTSILLLSSFFMNRAETCMATGDEKGFFRNAGLTLGLGSMFLIGVVGVEWQIAPYGPAHSAAYSLFYTMTGFHAFHVLTGLIFIAIVYRNTRLGLYSSERHWPVEAAAVYWHFVDVIWVFFYPALYLIGQAV